jgi:7-cyano-7-deazaguanine reductase
LGDAAASRAQTMTTDQSPLGKPTAYPDRYDASLLFAIERAPQRVQLGIAAAQPFSGVDIWTAYEISWLDRRGKPMIAVGEIRIGAESPATVESKSLKLYLGSFAQERVDTIEELTRRIEADLSKTCAAPVDVELLVSPAMLRVAELPGESIDDRNVAVDTREPDAALLKHGTGFVEESLRTALFRSNCPVTGQPDYADVAVHYRGPRIDRTALLKYFVSYRQHAAFHETCVERMFIDIGLRCRPEQLTVYARFLRRGGIDINSFRTNFEPAPRRNERTPRQ